MLQRRCGAHSPEVHSYSGGYMRIEKRSGLALAALVVFTAASLPSAKADCPSSDLSADFAKIPVRNQGETQLCNAEATSALIDYWRCKKETNPKLCDGAKGIAGDTTSPSALFGAGYKEQWGQYGEKRLLKTDMADATNVPGNSPGGLLKTLLKTPPANICTVSQFEATFKKLAELSGDDSEFWKKSDLTEEQIVEHLAHKNGNKKSGSTLDPSIQGIFKDWYDSICPSADIKAIVDADKKNGFDPFWEMGANANLSTNAEKCIASETDRKAFEKQIREVMQSVFPNKAGNANCGKYSNAEEAWGQLWPTMIEQTADKFCGGTSLVASIAPNPTPSPAFVLDDTGLLKTKTSLDGKTHQPKRLDPDPAAIKNINDKMKAALNSHVPTVLSLCYYNVSFPGSSIANDQSTGDHCRKAQADTYNNSVKDQLKANPSQHLSDKELERVDLNAATKAADVTHAVVLIGSAVHAGSCQYQVRGSYGKDCGTKRSRCGQCPTAGAFSPPSTAAKCDQAEVAKFGCCQSEMWGNGCCDMNGNQWFDQSLLEMNTIGATSITPGRPAP